MQTFEEWAGSLQEKSPREQILDGIKSLSLEAFKAKDPNKLATVSILRKMLDCTITRTSIQNNIEFLEKEGLVKTIRSSKPYRYITKGE